MKGSLPLYTKLILVSTILFPLVAVAAPQNQPQIARERAQAPTQQRNGTTADIDDASQTVVAASRALQEMFNQAEQQILASELQNAAAVAIFPDMLRAGLIVGGRHGSGVLLARNQDQWSPPVFISISGGSLGAQLGVESSDLVLIFKNSASLEEMLQNNDFTIGVDASVVAGSTVARAEATTRDADILTYQRAEGLFAGVALTGAVLNFDETSTMAYYDLDDQTVRGYYGDSEQLALAILGVQVPTESADRPGIQQVPENARDLQEILRQYTSGTQ
jgi:lipid-binding SYLF domain-containing protein